MSTQTRFPWVTGFRIEFSLDYPQHLSVIATCYLPAAHILHCDVYLYWQSLIVTQGLHKRKSNFQNKAYNSSCNSPCLGDVWMFVLSICKTRLFPPKVVDIYRQASLKGEKPSTLSAEDKSKTLFSGKLNNTQHGDASILRGNVSLRRPFWVWWFHYNVMTNHSAISSPSRCENRDNEESLVILDESRLPSSTRREKRRMHGAGSSLFFTHCHLEKGITLFRSCLMPQITSFSFCLLFNNMLIIFWRFKHIYLYMQCLLRTLFNCNFKIIDVGILWCSFVLCSVWSLHAFPISRWVVSGCFVLVLQSKDMRLADWWNGITKLTFRCKCECEWFVSTVC